MDSKGPSSQHGITTIGPQYASRVSILHMLELCIHVLATGQSWITILMTAATGVKAAPEIVVVHEEDGEVGRPQQRPRYGALRTISEFRDLK